VRREDRGDVGPRFMDLLDQLGDPRGHHEEVLSLGLPGVPERVGNATPSEYGRPWGSLDLIVTESEAQRPGQHVPRLIVPTMDMERCDPVVANLCRPLDDHEVIAR